ncbi:MAG: heterodisulfide reductase subunit B [Candidatus Omnitrophica bacterium CG11_big_fil_rev_8_21_14_0_20_43_6]|nr:MAG: heterodisulfide reductase subunit B [Candidatus Omnitrophica bacterium CG11_big_fil_rev_8_21_14_0_20_43_6]
MKYAYFPGCSLHSTAKEYDISARAVAGALGIELLEIPDWVCCGATPAHLTLHLLSLALPVKNLLAAKKLGNYEVATCCAACFSRLKIANKFMEDDLEHRGNVEEIVGAKYSGEVKVRHFLDILVNVFGLKNINQRVTKKLSGLKVACYYGCLLTRPPEVTQLDDLEDPHLMDDLMKIIGAEPVQWPYKTECCGASFSLTKTDIVLKLSGDILQMAQDEGAQAIVVACPLCQSNLDLRQGMINKQYKKKFNIPVFYFTQLLGLALGIEGTKLGLEKHLVNPLPLLREKGIIAKR